MSEISKKWYVVRAAGGKEKKAKEYIENEIMAKDIKELVTEAISQLPNEEVANLIDAIKNLGFKAATESGLSVSVTDCKMIDEKKSIVDKDQGSLFSDTQKITRKQFENAVSLVNELLAVRGKKVLNLSYNFLSK